ncbi:hypothetical protein N7509_005882 [Penicillium cosmopolitanum]|uniref:Uncharacterized protein n=1 Tax=Penicillium cosmopolitanum TaxID=1131564 RepID=A0A9W9W304_9EURO|nr:uncharacterized protein N7509_005882 [Penicillium cosmopolitanum]KAJ5397769.1 hypothetical protein N7509_005882 [Penicillium cosmopolitanum]
MKFEDGGSASIRLLKPGATMFPQDKVTVHNKVEMIRYSIKQYTTNPVQFVLHWGTGEENSNMM